MFRPQLIDFAPKVLVQSSKRFAGQYVLDGPLPRRPLKKIRLGKARPAIYYKFNCTTEFSDGSVVIRRSQYPKDELRLIQDQRNNPLWNPHRADLEAVDANAGGKLEKFKQKFASFNVIEESELSTEESKKEESVAKTEVETEVETEVKAKDDESFLLDDYLDLLGQNVQDVQKGGKLATKQKGKKK
ncbi:hypothetical protein WICMUC_000411 [Wickerhamomyces mucosus]|uniref:Ribosomal protein bL31m N-terminal domain-containing protein n=1 Tax=Wickerhamomyces mucosus TaxID=1378264 RepID=A0A9P8TIS3_9ASCO|nr:hypothetical protein WICMUC_000411 [Wickerhamomyces mucosus]